METENANFLIIGAGLAGITFAHFLEERNINFEIVDAVHFSDSSLAYQKNDYLNPKHPFQSASFVSTGLINPVTGRRFVKSWMIEKLLPFAVDFYTKIGKKLNANFIKPMPILRYFQDKTSENDWSVRINDPNYINYFQKEKYIAKGYKLQENSILFTKSYKVDVQNYISKSIAYFKSKSQFINKNVAVENFEISDNEIKTPFSQNAFSKAIFCEGYKAQFNPYFGFIPFTSQRGQLLEAEINDLDDSISVKKKIQITPFKKNNFTISTTWDWDVLNPIPTEKAKNNLLTSLSKMTNLPYKINKQKAAIRPTIKDRRPVLGNSKTNANLLIFNGLGSKGSSIAPFFANELVQNIFDGKPLLKDVNVERFY